jgi:hypothetical protein
MSDRELRDFARSFAKGILGAHDPDMYCFMVSAPLASCLSAMGVEAELVEGEVCGQHHCWVRLGDGRIIDATAKQFQLPNIFVKKPPNYYHDCE